MNALLIILLLLDMDVDLDVDPAPAADETAFPAPSAQPAPEASIDPEVIAPAPSVIILPAPSVPPATSGVKNIEKSSAVSAAASGEVQVPLASISFDASIEDTVVDGLKESLAKASEFELRLRELASDAGMMKTKMHVSTYVSPLPTGCNCCVSELFLLGF